MRLFVREIINLDPIVNIRILGMLRSRYEVSYDSERGSFFSIPDEDVFSVRTFITSHSVHEEGF